MRMLHQALRPFFTNQEHICPLCVVGFETKRGLNNHTRGSKCHLTSYPQHTALLHWAFLLTTTNMRIPEKYKLAFSNAALAACSPYTMEETSPTYSRFSRALGLAVICLPNPPPHPTKLDSAMTLFGEIINTMATGALSINEQSDLTAQVVQEFVALRVSITSQLQG